MKAFCCLSSNGEVNLKAVFVTEIFDGGFEGGAIYEGDFFGDGFDVKI